MAQIALFRKYRSQTFEDLIGQDHVVRTLQSALSTNRIAQAFLFTGPRGTGKTSSARLLAKCLNCETGPTPTPCNVCDQCVEITNGTSIDVMEMDAASDSGVDEVREKIIDVAQYQPMSARYKVIIIDEVHDLSPKAFDALLKTIEEPPAHLVFILATTEYNKVPPTIRSRCQKFEFHRASIQNLVDRIEYVCKQEGITADTAAVSAIARMADGGYRDALTLLEQATLVSSGNISLQVVYDQLGLITEDVIDELLLAIRAEEVGKLIQLLEDISRTGRDPRAILESALHRLADLTRASYQVPVQGADAPREAAMHEFATRLGRDFLLSTRTALAEAHKVIRDISLPRLWLESELIRLATRKHQAPATVANKAAAEPQTSRPAPAPSGGSSMREELAREKAEKRAAAAASVPPARTEEHDLPPVQPKEPEAELPRAFSGVQEPELAEAIQNAEGGPDVWQRVYDLIPDYSEKSGGVPPIKLKLRDSWLVSDDGETITVGMGSAIFCDWVSEDPKRVGYLEKLVAQLGRTQTKLKFVAEKKKPVTSEDTEAVELPLEGIKLDRAVRDMFGLGQDSKDLAVRGE